jgi:hypothetical protein
MEEAIRMRVRESNPSRSTQAELRGPGLRRKQGDNIGMHVPQVHFLPSEGPAVVSLMLKGEAQRT